MRGRRRPAAFSETDRGKGRPDLAGLGEGISVAYGDDYDAHLEVRHRPTGVPARATSLVHTVNPGHYVAERSYRNNASRALIRIARDSRGRPAVKLLN